MSFLQFFVWGAWLITVGNYWFGTKGWSGAELGGIFNSRYCVNNNACTNRYYADRWINEKLYGILHILSGFAIFIYRKLMTLLFSIG
jgi:NHS family xanthosine MFS transporter